MGETIAEPVGPMSSAATSDAIGVIEIAASGKNAEFSAGIDRWEDTADIASDRNIIVIGSGIVNIYAFAFNNFIQPVHFVKSGGRIFDQIVVSIGRTSLKYFGPHTQTPKDCGLVVLCRNPLNLEKNLLWIAGITGMGTQVAMKLVSDLIRNPGKVLSEKFENCTIENPIAAIVCPNIPKGNWDISSYYKTWRIPDYRILWLSDRDGNVFEAPL